MVKRIMRGWRTQSHCTLRRYGTLDGRVEGDACFDGARSMTAVCSSADFDLNGSTCMVRPFSLREL